MNTDPEIETLADSVDRYLADAAGVGERDDAVFARCDAVMALIPRVGESPDIAWAYEEAHRLARSRPAATAAPASIPWYMSSGPAWSAAGVLFVALLVSVFPRGPGVPAGNDAATAGPPTPTANITFAPIVVSSELAQTLAEIDPVVLIANDTPVDARSLVLLPFAQAENATSNPGEARVADSIYAQVLRQLSSVPGIIVIDAATAAIYADSGLAPEEIARQLGVRGIVEGRVAAVDGDIRFELRLTDAASAGSSIDEAIERPSNELAMLQSDIASSVIDALARTRPPIESDESL